MADVEALCKRVVVIHHGKILFDGPLARLGDQFDAFKTLTVELEDAGADLSGYGDVLEREDGRVKLRVPKAETARVTARLLAERDVADLTVEDPPIEDVIELVFAQERPERRGHRGGRTRPLVRLLPHRARTQIQSNFQYRVATYMWLIGMLAEPIVYLVVWTTIAEQQGGDVQGITTGQFAAYYIVWTLVRNMNIVFTPYGWEWRIREGELSAALLRPLHPIHDDIAGFAGWKVVTIILWLPIAAVLWLAFDPEFDLRAAEVGAFCVAIWGAYLIRTMFLSALGMVTFWTTRVSALFELMVGLELLLSGRLVPLPLMPGLGRGPRRRAPVPVVVLLPDPDARRRHVEPGAARGARHAAPLDRRPDGGSSSSSGGSPSGATRRWGTDAARASPGSSSRSARSTSSSTGRTSSSSCSSRRCRSASRSSCSRSSTRTRPS